mmetsp:Transcript_75227/g.193971  ORF Transcript_75227/g.193971 Transcript_75227/m.193971 type:complete len:173 (-) Transcript_75227:95-613(-)
MADRPPMPGMPGGLPLSPDDPMAPVMSVEDRAFLESFGRRISAVAGVSALVGGGAAYGAARNLGWRRPRLCAALGVMVTPIFGWYVVLMQERERVASIAQKLQLAMENDPRSAPPGESSSPKPEDAIARLFPPPPMMGATSGPPPPRGFGGGMPPPAFGAASGFGSDKGHSQ